MNSRKLLALCLIVFCQLAAAQQDNIWYFGYNAGLNFTTGDPEPLTNGQTETFEGTSVLSSPDGNLLFYTDGVTVWNSAHEAMENGTGLLGAKSSTHSGLIVATPGSENHYYIFTSDQYAMPSGIHYSEVDLSANGGLGEVIVKNVPLLALACEKLAVVPHANGTDVWVIGHQWEADAFYSWPVTITGVGDPVVSNTGVFIGGDSMASAGYLKASAGADKIVAANTGLNCQLFDFDNGTGVLSNPVTLLDQGAYGVEFSPSGDLLYVTSGPMVYQFDLNAADIPASVTPIADMGVHAGGLQLAPDSKIYISGYGTNKLSVISRPNALGVACTVEQGIIDLAGKVAYWGLPVFAASPFNIIDIIATGDCSGAETTFVLHADGLPDSILWEFGDGSFSTAISPVHSYAAAGTYKVKIKAKKGNYTRFYTREITINPTPLASTPDDMWQCSDGGTQATFNLHFLDEQVLSGQSGLLFNVSYHLAAADAESGVNALPGVFTNTQNPQTLYARVSSPTAGCYAITSFNVGVAPQPVIDMPDNYAFCEGGSVTINAPEGFESYLWSTGETGPAITVHEAGEYTVAVVAAFGNLLCEGSKTVTVRSSGPPVIKEVITEEWTDNSNSITIMAEGTGNYEYSIDGIIFQDSPVFNSLQSGRYTVHTREKNGCGEAQEEVLLFMYPKYFTPNGDGMNETWRIEYAYWEPGMFVHIYDRYGKFITSIKGGGPGWDGNMQGQKLPSTDYWFVVESEKGIETKGHFALLR